MNPGTVAIVLASIEELTDDLSMLDQWMADSRPNDAFRLRLVATARVTSASLRRLEERLAALRTNGIAIEGEGVRGTRRVSPDGEPVARYSRTPWPARYRCLPRYEPSEIDLLRRYCECLRRCQGATPPGRPPDWIGVGAQKAGTTWWAQLLSEHPEIALPVKELHYFDGMRDMPPPPRALASYHLLFTTPPCTLAGEFTPSYLFREWIPPLLRAVAPAARILLILRDPTQRYRSGLAHELRLGRPLDEERHREHLERGLYARQLARIFTHFPRSNVLVLQYEQLARNPLDGYRKTLAFLGAKDVDFVPPSIGRRIHESDKSRAALDPVLRRSLAATFEADSEWLRAHVPEIDLSLWSGAAA